MILHGEREGQGEEPGGNTKARQIVLDEKRPDSRENCVLKKKGNRTVTSYCNYYRYHCLLSEHSAIPPKHVGKVTES